MLCGESWGRCGDAALFVRVGFSDDRRLVVLIVLIVLVVPLVGSFVVLFVFVTSVVGVSRRRRVADEAPVDQPDGNVLGDARSHVGFRWMLRHGAALPCSCHFLTSRIWG